MNIVVCVKWVISPDNTIKVDGNAIKNKGLYYVVNPCDLVAVEEAVRLKESHGQGEVILLSMGPPLAKEGLRHCLAIGTNRGIILSDPAFEGSDSYATATVLSEAIKGLDYNLVLCGHRAADVEEGQVGAILGEFLGIPVITSAIEIKLASDNKITVHRRLERGNREVVEANLPALVTVETGLNKPRYPRLRDIYAAQRKEIKDYDLKALNLNPEQVGARGSKVRLLAHLPPRPKPKKIFTPDSSLSAAERMRLIMSGGVKKKQSNLIEGKPDYIASNVARFLTEQKLFPQ